MRDHTQRATYCQAALMKCNVVRVLTMEVVIKGVVRDKFIDKQPLLIVYTITHKRNQMAMMYTTDNLNLCSELAITLSTVVFELLYGYFSSIL